MSALNCNTAQHLADRMNRESRDKIRWSYLPRKSVIEGAWYVAEIDCLNGNKTNRRIYHD